MYISFKDNIFVIEEMSNFVPLAYQIEHDILDMIVDNFLKTQDIASNLASFYRTRFTLHSNKRNMYLSSKNCRGRASRPLGLQQGSIN